jgi:hypothetical protein
MVKMGAFTDWLRQVIKERFIVSAMIGQFHNELEV